MGRRKTALIAGGTFAGLVATALAVKWLNRKNSPVSENEERETIEQAERRVAENSAFIQKEEAKIKRLLRRISDGSQFTFKRIFARKTAEKLDYEEP